MGKWPNKTSQVSDDRDLEAIPEGILARGRVKKGAALRSLVEKMGFPDHNSGRMRWQGKDEDDI